MTILIGNERSHVHDSDGCAHFAVARRVTDMALQPFLGLLPEWGIGLDRGCSADFAPCRSAVKGVISTGTGLKLSAVRLNPEWWEQVPAIFC